MRFKDRIRKLRKENNFSPLELAQALNLSKSSIDQYESGAKIPSTEKLIEIADYFQVSLDYLTGRDTEDMDVRPDVGEIIKRIRNDNNYTQKDLAFMVDMNVKKLINIEEAKEMPDMDSLKFISYTLRVPISLFLIPKDMDVDEVKKFALDTENREYIKLAMKIKAQGLNPDEVEFFHGLMPKR